MTHSKILRTKTDLPPEPYREVMIHTIDNEWYIAYRDVKGYIVTGPSNGHSEVDKDDVYQWTYLSDILEKLL